MDKKIPTAQDYFEERFLSGELTEIECMIRFAKLHCEAQLEAIIDSKIKGCFSAEMYPRFAEDKEVIRNAYPLSNIQ